MDHVRDNAEASRFERDTPFGMVIADYRERDGVRAIVHVEAPPQARGQGLAAALMDGIVVHARARRLKLAPRCSYAVAYFARHPDASDVLA